MLITNSHALVQTANATGKVCATPGDRGPEGGALTQLESEVYEYASQNVALVTVAMADGWSTWVTVEGGRAAKYYDAAMDVAQIMVIVLGFTCLNFVEGVYFVLAGLISKCKN